VITQTAEYALRAVVYLAEQQQVRTTYHIAEKTRLPVGYLSKVMQGLVKAGLVHSQRGLHGGFILTVSPKELTILQVINAVEPIRRFHECPLGLHGTSLCPLHRKLNDAALSVEKMLSETTIAELNDAPQSRRPLCSFPSKL
jgi:Rrf2 family protein